MEDKYKSAENQPHFPLQKPQKTRGGALPAREKT